MNIGERIKEIRRDQKMNQAEFGLAVGIGLSAVSAIEIGKNNPSEQTIRAICQEFGVNRRWLETGEGDAYVPGLPEDALAEEVAEIMKGESPMAQAIMTSLASMPREWWDAWAVELHKRIDAKKDR